MTKKKRVILGDIVLIPVDDGRYAVGKVLYLSKHYKSVILLGLFRAALTEKAMPTSIPDEIGLLLYTVRKAIEHDRWFWVGNEAIKSHEQGLAKRLVGNRLWLEDQDLGVASDEEFRTYPQMDVYGAGLVEIKAKELIKNEVASN